MAQPMSRCFSRVCGVEEKSMFAVNIVYSYEALTRNIEVSHFIPKIWKYRAIKLSKTPHNSIFPAGSEIKLNQTKFNWAVTQLKLNLVSTKLKLFIKL